MIQQMDKKKPTDDPNVMSSPNSTEIPEEAKKLLEKYDRESNYRTKLGMWAWVVSFLGIALTLFHLYTGYFGSLHTHKQGAIHLGTALGLIFLLYPAKKGLQRKQTGVPWYDVILAFAALFAVYYKVAFHDVLSTRGITYSYTDLDMIVAALGILLLLEATRRCVGLPIVIIATLAIAYALWGNHIPFKVLQSAGLSLERVTLDLFYKDEGIFGTPLRISSTFIYLFLFFGVILIKTNIGQFFNDLAFAATGRFTGGTAKAAVTASAMQGMVSGSSIANTVGSGSFTIPMMKRAGYKPEFSAAAEASASTGGQLMPPIMGAAAFIMASYVEVPYREVMLAALIPAILYFTGIFIGTHFESKKMGIYGAPKAQLPAIKPLLLQRGYLLIPLIVIIGTLLSGFTPMRAALLGIGAAFLCSLFRKDTRLSFKNIVETLEQGARVALPVIAAVGTAGIVVGVVANTGLGGTLGSAVIQLAQGSLLLALFLTMLTCILLGMGLPTTANYVVTATVAAPILINNFDLSPIAVHLFVFYFGIIADITPPVCLAAYAGSGIAKSNPFKTGLTAVKLAIAAFIIPYIFVMNPMLVLVDYTPVALAISIVTAILGMVGISSSMMGFLIRKTHSWERIALFIAGLLLVSPNLWVDLAGLVIILAVWFVQSRRPDVKVEKTEQTTESV